MLQQYVTRHFKVCHLQALVEVGTYCYNDRLYQEKLLLLIEEWIYCKELFFPILYLYVTFYINLNYIIHITTNGKFQHEQFWCGFVLILG